MGQPTMAEAPIRRILMSSRILARSERTEVGDAVRCDCWDGTVC